MSSDSEPRLRVIWTDPVTGRRGYAVIDRMVNGLAGGGTRMRSGVTMQEVERLARTMSYKNGAFNLPGGGAKGGVEIDPHDPEARGVLSRYVRAMRPLYRSGWGTAEDLGDRKSTRLNSSHGYISYAVFCLKKKKKKKTKTFTIKKKKNKHINTKI